MQVKWRRLRASTHPAEGTLGPVGVAPRREGIRRSEFARRRGAVIGLIRGEERYRQRVLHKLKPRTKALGM